MLKLILTGSFFLVSNMCLADQIKEPFNLKSEIKGKVPLTPNGNLILIAKKKSLECFRGQLNEFSKKLSELTFKAKKKCHQNGVKHDYCYQMVAVKYSFKNNWSFYTPDYMPFTCKITATFGLF